MRSYTNTLRTFRIRIRRNIFNKTYFSIHSLNTTTFLFTFSEIMIRRILDQRPQSETIPVLFKCIRKVLER